VCVCECVCVCVCACACVCVHVCVRGMRTKEFDGGRSSQLVCRIGKKNA